MRREQSVQHLQFRNRSNGAS